MKNLIEKKQQLHEIRNNLIIESELVGDKIGLSLTDDKIDTDKLATQSTVIQAKLQQLEKEFVIVDRAIEAQQIADDEKEADRLFDIRKDHLKSACVGIRKAWDLQEKLSEMILDVKKHDDLAVTNNDEVLLQCRLMIGSLMGNCNLHHVSHAGIASLKKNLFPADELARAESNLRR